jgi:hypothetical protein
MRRAIVRIITITDPVLPVPGPILARVGRLLFPGCKK